MRAKDRMFKCLRVMMIRMEKKIKVMSQLLSVLNKLIISTLRESNHQTLTTLRRIKEERRL